MPRSEVCIGLITLTLLVAASCSPVKTEHQTAGQVKAENSPHRHEGHPGNHVHYGAGPHGGSIIELGGQDYHAELVIDHDSHTIKVYLLSADAKTPLMTNANRVTLSTDSRTDLVLLAPKTNNTTTDSHSSFELSDVNLFHSIVDQGYLHGDLSVQIHDKPFVSHLDIHLEHGEHKPDHRHSDEVR